MILVLEQLNRILQYSLQKNRSNTNATIKTHFRSFYKKGIARNEIIQVNG